MRFLVRSGGVSRDPPLGKEGSGLTSCSLRSQATRVSETFVLFPTQRVNVLALGVPKTFMCQRIKSVKGKATAASPERGQERWTWRVLSLRVLVCLHVHASFVCMRPFAYMCPFEKVSLRVHVCRAAREPAERACSRACELGERKANPRAPSAPETKPDPRSTK